MKLPLKRSVLALVFALALGLTSFSFTAFAEDSSSNTLATEPAAPTAQSVEKTAASPEPTSKIFGLLDLRAEYYGSPGAWDTANYLNFGYQFNPNFKMSWYQGFDSNIYLASKAGSIANANGFNPVLDQGYLRTKVDKIWQSGTLSFSYESRIYVPTWAFDYNAGNVTRLYNAFKLIDKVNSVVTLTGAVIIMPQVYNVAGTTFEGPNSWLENRLYLIADFQLSKKWSLTFPILLYQDKYRDYTLTSVNTLLGGSSGDWGYFLYIWPELDYAINDTLSVGLSYISGNMVTPDFGSTSMGTAFRTGILQFVVDVTI